MLTVVWFREVLQPSLTPACPNVGSHKHKETDRWHTAGAHPATAISAIIADAIFGMTSAVICADNGVEECLLPWERLLRF